MKCYPLKTKEAPFECKAIFALAKTNENPVLEIWMWIMKCLHLIIHELFSKFSRGIWLARAYFVLLIVALIHRTGKVGETVLSQSLRVRPSLTAWATPLPIDQIGILIIPPVVKQNCWYWLPARKSFLGSQKLHMGGAPTHHTTLKPILYSILNYSI